MELTLGDVETTALIPLAIKANESLRPNARIYDGKIFAFLLPKLNDRWALFIW